LQQQALGQQAQLAAAAPSIYAQQYIPSQQLAQIGAAQEQIDQLPLQEQMNRFYFNQQLPAQQLQSYLSSIYATPMSSSQFAPQPQATSSRVGSVLGGAGLGYGIGNMIGGTGAFGTSAGTTGAVLGGLAGLLI
jgi:outer membrane lipoprotein SlyB